MSDVSAVSLALLRRIGEFLDELPEDQVVDLAEGRARLTYIPLGSTEPPPPLRKKARFDPDAVVAELREVDSRDAGRELLRPLTVTNVRAVAKAAGMGAVSKTSKPDLTEQLIGLLVGGRLSYAAMRGY